MSAARLLYCLKCVTVNNCKQSVFKRNNFIRSYKENNQIFSVIRFKSKATFLDSYNENPENVKKKKGTILTKDGKEVKKSTLSDSKIVVINLDNTKSYLYLSEAEKLAKRMRCRIEVVEDKSNQKVVYKLIKGFPDKDKSEDKNYKNMLIGTKITENDLDIKIKSLLRVAEKGKSIKIAIEEKNMEASNLDTVFKRIETKLIGTDTQILNKTKSSKRFSFIVAPLKKKDDENDKNAKKEISERNDENIEENMTNNCA